MYSSITPARGDSVSDLWGKLLDQYNTYGSFTAEAKAYFSAAGITATNEKSAYNAFVVGLKADGIYSKMRVVRPFLGTSAAQQSYNAVTPASNQITWHGTVTHSNLGIQGDGSTGYGDENYDLTGKNLGSIGMSLDLGTIGKDVVHNMGAFNSGGANEIGFTRVGNLLCDDGSRITISNSTPGIVTLSRRSLSDFEVYQNGATAGTDTGTIGSFSIPLNSWLCAQNNDSATFLPTDARILFSAIHDSLTGPEMAALFNRVYGLQVSLGRASQPILSGDSLMAGHPDPTVGPGVKLAGLDWRLSPRVTAVDGSTLEGILASITALVTQYFYSDKRATVPTFLAGTNDLSVNSRTAADLMGYMTSICAAVRSAGATKIVVVTIPARSGQTAGFETNRLAYNAWLRDPANAGGSLWAACCDIASMSQFQNPADTTYYNADGTHFSETGNSVFAAAMQTTMDSILTYFV